MDAIRFVVQQKGEIVGGTPLQEEALAQTTQGAVQLLTSNPLLMVGIIVVIIIIVYLIYSYLTQ